MSGGQGGTTCAQCSSTGVCFFRFGKTFPLEFSAKRQARLTAFTTLSAQVLKSDQSGSNPIKIRGIGVDTYINACCWSEIDRVLAAAVKLPTPLNDDRVVALDGIARPAKTGEIEPNSMTQKGLAGRSCFDPHTIKRWYNTNGSF